MDENIKLIAAIVAVITAIFGLFKAYIELKKVILDKRNKNQKTAKEGTMRNTQSRNVPINKSKLKGNSIGNVDNSTSIYGDVIIDTHSEQTANSEDIILLKDKYTSLFVEEDRLKTEQIVITKQKNGTVEGTVTLYDEEFGSGSHEQYTYYLKGRFINKILTAEYFSHSADSDERGAINLKLIDRDVLSGFCSFSKLASSVDDEIRVSPYVWVAGENKDLVNGMFDFCTECYNEHKVCCCASEKVDMPVFMNSELAAIRNQLVAKNTEKNTFSKALSAPFQNSAVRQMKRDVKKEKEGVCTSSKCYFYNIEEQKCRIYAGRPVDCRLFPYDIRVSDDKKEYVIGYYNGLCERNLPDKSIMKKKAHILRPYFFLLYPYLHIITSNEVCQRLNNADFEEIARFKDFVF